MTGDGHGHLTTKVGALLLASALAACARPAVESAAPRRGAVRPGIEGILGDSAHLIRGRAIGLVANASAVDMNGVNDVDRLLRAGARLVAIFSPEHGFRGVADPGETVASSVDSATGLPIYSLYGRTYAPTDSMLRGIDVLLVDLPDVGARYFTWLGTTIEVMKAGARAGLPVIVLDRPNPIGGLVQGNMLEPAHRSFVGALAMPMRHGLTLGELARLARIDLGLTTDLTVVPAAGWQRRDTQIETGMPFLPPSPNLKDVEALFHYPGTCLFEATALSVGRGTDAPFRQVGAPWLDPAKVLARLAPEARQGVRFEAVEFTPRKPGDGKYDGVTVRGIRLIVSDRNRYDPTLTAVALMAAVRAVHPDSLAIRAAGLDRLAGGPSLRESLLAGRDPVALHREWQRSREPWLAHRLPALLYK